MLSPRRVLSVAALVATALTQSAVHAASLDLNGWYSCSSVSFEESLPTTEVPESITTNSQMNEYLNGGSSVPEAECAIFQAPLCYDDVCESSGNRTIDVFVKRIVGSRGGENLPNVFFMQGGPGAASPAMESAMISLYYQLSGNVNVYTMDHRGTGRSTKLDCIAAQALTSASPSGSSVSIDEVGDCAADLEKLYDGDLAAFSITSAASDLNYFISSYLTDSQTFVYGVSYGTAVVERLIHLNTTEIAGYILDGVATSSGSNKKNFEYFSTWDVDYDEVAAYFLSKCEKYPEDCGKYFEGSSVSTALKTLLKNLENSSFKCTTTVDKHLSALYGIPSGLASPAELLRSIMGQLFADATLRNLIPVLTYRFSRCNDDDIAVTSHFFKTMGGSLTQISEEDAFTSDLEYKLIVYSELWETPTPTYEELMAKFLNTSISSGTYSEVGNYCAFTKAKDPGCADYAQYAEYEASSIVYKRDKYWNVAAQPSDSASVLLLSSKMDPQTPHKYAELLYEALDTKNKKLVTFEHATHGTIWTTPISNSANAPICGMYVLASYVSVGGDISKMDASCVEDMPELSFKVPDELLSDWLNTTSAYDGAFDGDLSSLETGASGSGSSGTNYKTVFIVFLVLFILVAIAAVFVFIKWRRAKRQAINHDFEVATPVE
ncbi:hypothetical protein Poli38472_010035 [Pythium oligandrum]|uniref:Uncharacterized protein n=1 Tax=Pythium oligandrum TaxID=41045 RepID=A0A8K1C880_PYTOL|nr:hypothetical protein Poli38472_010035 [Pythium oligandrum]|eukprot:TMW58476.1 hypothetical protein Poli38472_010035 [Pythium oligandrum]